MLPCCHAAMPDWDSNPIVMYWRDPVCCLSVRETAPTAAREQSTVASFSQMHAYLARRRMVNISLPSFCLRAERSAVTSGPTSAFSDNSLFRAANCAWLPVVPAAAHEITAHFEPRMLRNLHQRKIHSPQVGVLCTWQQNPRGRKLHSSGARAHY